MSATWREDDEELRVGGVKGALKAKTRFSFTEVKLLLEAVKRNRYIILRKFNQGVSAETKKQTWVEITNQINGLGENHREVRQIMKKWADLKCDGKRRIAALRGPNGTTLRKKKLGPVERMVHKILMMSPRGDGDSDLDLGEDDDFSKMCSKGLPSSSSPYSYLSLTDGTHTLSGGPSFEISPLSSPEKELGEQMMDFDENDDSMFSYPSSVRPPPTSLDPLPDNALMRVKPVYTYSRSSNGQSQTIQNSSSSSRPPPGPSSSSVASTSSGFPLASDSEAASASAVPPPSRSPSTSNRPGSALPAPSSFPPPSSSSAPAAANGASSHPRPSTSIPPPEASSAFSTVTSATISSSSRSQPPPSSSIFPRSAPTSGSSLSDPLPAGASSRRAHEQVAQVASQSLQQQRASRMLLTSVSQSLETLAQSVQLLVESQHEFVQESLQLQRETVDILRDFSNTALTMLRDKASSGQLAHHHHRHHPASHF
uniref:Myb/SANT-like DNA-binding domain-containing protein n=1 Tax=Astatotilapia calliptera TaxID=8154 RepID=A0AAX7VJM2_ASTCA